MTVKANVLKQQPWEAAHPQEADSQGAPGIQAHGHCAGVSRVRALPLESRCGPCESGRVPTAARGH